MPAFASGKAGVTNWILPLAKTQPERVAAPEQKTPLERVVCSGAATQIRTGDFILTKDVLYQLSHSSTLLQVFPLSECYYIKKILLCQYFFQKINFSKRISNSKNIP